MAGSRFGKDYQKRLGSFCLKLLSSTETRQISSDSIDARTRLAQSLSRSNTGSVYLLLVASGARKASPNFLMTISRRTLYDGTRRPGTARRLRHMSLTQNCRAVDWSM